MGEVQKFDFHQVAECVVIRPKDAFNDLHFKGLHKHELWRNGKKIRDLFAMNDIVNQGKNDILTAYFYGGTQTLAASWFVGLIDQAGFTALNPTDVMNSHAGWAEWTSYTQTTRVALGPAAPASQTMQNASVLQFNISANGTIMGVFICTDGTKAGTTGKLWSTALYTAPVPVQIGDQIRSNYTLSC